MPITTRTSIRKTGSAPLTGDVTLTQGANITLTQLGNDITIVGTGGSGTFSITEAEIDLGSTPVAEAIIAVVNASVTALTKILGGVAYAAPTGKDLDELEMDAIEVKFEPGVGTFNVHIKGLEGYLSDKFKIWYTFA